MWDVGSRAGATGTRSFPYWSAFAAAQPVAAADGDKAAFLGRYGDWAQPGGARRDAPLAPLFGRHHDPIAALRLPGRRSRRTASSTAASSSPRPSEPRRGTRRWRARFAAPRRWTPRSPRGRRGWRDRSRRHRDRDRPSRLSTARQRLAALPGDLGAALGRAPATTSRAAPTASATSCRTAQVWLTIDPTRCRAQIRLHAAHQFADGSVYHWWHPLTEQGHVTRMTDDLLWLAFVDRELPDGDRRLLDPRRRAPVPRRRRRRRPLAEHVERAFARVFSRTSPRGLPLHRRRRLERRAVGGRASRSAASRSGSRMFLAGLLADWAEIAPPPRRRERAAELPRAARGACVAAINEHAWDGAWYRRATRDDGTWIGSAGNERRPRSSSTRRPGRSSNDVAPPERAARLPGRGPGATCVSRRRRPAARPRLRRRPTQTIGYITRYAPGLRENGGVYTHAATWAIAAAAQGGRRRRSSDGCCAAINPALKDPERYWAEPYVLPGNVDGPARRTTAAPAGPGTPAPPPGCRRVVSEWVLGVRPTWEGLLLRPLPADRLGSARDAPPLARRQLEVEIEGGPGCESRGGRRWTASGDPDGTCSRGGRGRDGPGSASRASRSVRREPRARRPRRDMKPRRRTARSPSACAPGWRSRRARGRSAWR